MPVREISAEEAAKRLNQGGAPPSSGVVRDFTEGVASVGGRLFDAFNAFPLAMAGGPAQAYEAPSYGYDATGTISEATDENPTRALVAGRGVGGAVASLPLVAMTGGVSGPVVAANLAGGAGGELAADQARRMGGGGLAQFGAGLAGDLTASGVVRGALALPNLISSMTPTHRASGYVGNLGIGQETAEDAASAIRMQYGIDKEDVDKAYDIYRSIPSTGTTSPDPFIDLANAQKRDLRFSKSELPEVAKDVLRELDGQPIGVEDIEGIRRGASNVGANANLTANTRRLAGQFKDVSDDALMDIAAQSGADSAAATALSSAIAKRRALGKAFPEDSGLFEMIVDPKALSPDEAQAAFTKFINSTSRNQEIDLALSAVSGNKAARRGLNKALALGILNSTEESATNRVASQLDRADKAKEALTKAWGEEGYKHFRRMLSEQTTQNRSRAFVWRWLAAGKGSPTKGLVAGGALGQALGVPGGATVGMATGAAIDLLAQKLSPRTVREIAFHSLYDPELYRQVTRKIPRGANANEWLGVMTGSLVRRGIVTPEEAEAAE